MVALVLAAGLFLGLHVFISGTSLRGAIVGRIGDGPYQGLFSLASLTAIVWLSRAYGAVLDDGTNVAMPWAAPAWLTHLGTIVVLFAFLLVAIGLTTPSPTAVGGERVLGGPDAVRGIHRITRHPFLWGVLLWASFHLVANADLASTIFFGTFAALAILGPFLIDAKRERAYGARWQAYADATSNVPFAAIFSGRNHLALGEIAWWQWLFAVGVYAAFLLGHLWLFGVSPIPGWTPY